MYKLTNEELIKLDEYSLYFEQHRPNVHAKRDIVILTEAGYIGTKRDIPKEKIEEIEKILANANKPKSL